MFCIFVGTKIQKLSINQRLGNLIPIFVLTNNLCNFVSFWFVSFPHTDGELKKDFIGLLPKEIVMFVFGYLESSDLLKAIQTRKMWRIHAEDVLL